jgi:hypothetical protein
MATTTRLAALWCFALLIGCGETGVSVDASIDASPTFVDADPPIDSFYAWRDAFRNPVEVLYRNPSPPDCVDRTQPPIWRAPPHGRLEGTVLWSVSLMEPRFTNWRQQITLEDYFRSAPSLSGDGIATWFYATRDRTESRALGLVGPVGSFANSGNFDFYSLPRVWLPRFDAIFFGNAAAGRTMYAPQPEFYSPETPEVRGVTVVPGSAGSLWDGGPRVTHGVSGDMPAWSPVTGDFVAFGVLFDPSERYRGVGSFCTEGTRWFTQLPIYADVNSAFVRPVGDVIVAGRGEMWVLDGETGEALRSATYRNDDDVPVWPSTYHAGCGLLVMTEYDQAWRWLDDETMEWGPDLRFPEGLATNTGFWSGTPDCGLVALVGDSPGSLSVTRLAADGSVRHSTVFRGPEESGSFAGPPIALADGGTLGITNPAGWVRYSPDGVEVSRVRLEGGATSDPALAPDGTLFMMLGFPFEYRFIAAATGAVPGPFLWPNSGYNWARTNSVLPE